MSGCSRRQFIAGGAIAALGGTLALAGCAPMSHEEAAAKKKDEAAAGKDAAKATTATGEGMGKHGKFTVEVAMNDGAIDRITVLDSRETPGMGDVAMEKMTKAIVDNQTLAVDTISGATLTSMAFLTAVGSALDTLGESSEDWKNREPASWTSDVKLPEETDVVVIGAGGAGFAAAITAANEGKNVVLMDKMGVYGGDTALSGGEMAVPGNWIQVTQGVKDSPEELVSDMLVGGDNKGDPELVAIIANGLLVNEAMEAGKALAEAGVVSPLRRAGMTKANVRHVLAGLEASFGLAPGTLQSAKPSFPCLAVYVPEGAPIDEASLAQAARTRGL